MLENPIVGIFFGTDIVVCALNVYCIICVISQYQQYLAGRGRAGQRANSQPIPTVRLQAEVSHSRNVPSVSYQVTKNGSATGLLMVPSPNSSSMTSKSPVPTDMSSISDEQSSNDLPRKPSADSGVSGTSSFRRSLFHNPFRKRESLKKESGNSGACVVVPEVTIKVEDTSGNQKTRFRF